MRTGLLAIACLGLLLVPTVAAQDIGGTVQDLYEEKEPCFLILARPYEDPGEMAAGFAAMAVCLATS